MQALQYFIKKKKSHGDIFLGKEVYSHCWRTSVSNFGQARPHTHTDNTLAGIPISELDDNQPVIAELSDYSGRQ